MKMKSFRFAALAAVLLVFCLVFATPVGATERPDDLPTAIVKELADGEGPTDFDLTFARNFTADYVTPEQLSTYGQWYADFILTTNKDMIVGTDGETSGYLAGNYGIFGWQKVPDKSGLGSLDNVPIPKDTAMPVIASALGIQEYSYIYESVQTFLCGMYLNPDFLEENPDIVITLELRMINPEDVPEDLNMNTIMDKSFVIGDSYEFALEWILTCKDEDGSPLLYKDGISNPTTYTVLSPTFILEEPVKEGYVFAGWKDADGSVHETVSIEEGTYGNKIYTATWKKLHTVTLTANGGKDTLTAGSVRDGESFDLPSCPFTAPEGKVFKAWLIDGTEYVSGVSYTVTEDTSVTAVWKDVGVAVKPTIETSVDVQTNGDVTTTTITPDENTVVNTVENTVTITDQSTGVKIDVQYDESSTVTDSGATGTVTSITVSYQQEQTESSGEIEAADAAEITQTVSFTLSKVTTDLPDISSAFDQNKADKVIGKNPNHKPLAMITAENAESVNNNMTRGTDKVTVTFKLPKALVESLVGTDISLLKAYHVKDSGEVIEAEINVEGPADGIYTVKVTGDVFSSYVLGYEEPKQTVSNNGGGKDTGSGNYQYYPREVTADGIIDFGTSKVVTGIELPVGSTGTVTLNTKPTITMPENGFYVFEIDAPGYNLDAKINGAISFKLTVAEIEAAVWTVKDVVLFHGTVAEDGKITWEALPTNLVKNENGIAYYKSAINGCSPFYIGFVKDGSVVNTEVVEPVTPPTDEPQDVPGEVLPEIPDVQDEPETPASPAPVLGLIAALGAAVVLRRK